MFPRWPRYVHSLLLPAALLLVTGLQLGCYFETNDDLAIIQLIRGVTAAGPVGDLHLYLHGLSSLLAFLCQTWPAVPWYGVLLFGLLYGATALAFAIIDRLLRGRVPTWKITLLLVLFYGTLWLEHALWFNYLRVPVLLAGCGLLYAAQRHGQRWAQVVGLGAFVVAWLIRPSAADVALLVALPGVWWLSGRRAMPLAAGALAWALVAGLSVALLRLPTEAAYRRLDVLKSNLNDYQLYQLRPQSAADSLGLELAANWMLADSTLVNEALFTRATKTDVPFFRQHVAPLKLRATILLLIRDYFPALLAMATLLAWVLAHPDLRRRWEFWLALAAWAVLLLGLGVVLKLPPRLALPLLDLVVLSALIFVLRDQIESERRAVRALVLVLGIAALPYAVKTGHRRQMLRAEQHRGLQLLREMRRRTYPAAVVVTDVLELAYKAQSPWRRPRLGSNVLFMSVTGWYTADPSQAQLRKHLTGTTDVVLALQSLARRRAAVKWYLTPTTAYLLNKQLALRTAPAEPQWRLVTRERVGSSYTSVPRLYVMALQTVKYR
ncbi:hypothetical protein FY528_14235 [Hymenobacter lutimineralis]|uniref:Glycosyltransferase RgtA/B/C/D-like domain-containing protein n=1 Tax=Hymenobacter lutimineralis TaxID=2606448 RepID=A0A5D6UYT2_9BACT|nr:hypothetical protein [Hymenobacter lutimineralis]TYZ07852.1 hypothetical protein FY528_14235 [Hymenobacter lutimineralis]